MVGAWFPVLVSIILDFIILGFILWGLSKKWK